MPVKTIRDLARNTREVVQEVVESGRPTLVTRQGKVAVAVVPVDDRMLAEFEDLVLGTVPEYLDAMREADEDLRTGRTVPLSAVLADMRAASSGKTVVRTDSPKTGGKVVGRSRASGKTTAAKRSAVPNAAKKATAKKR